MRNTPGGRQTLVSSIVSGPPLSQLAQRVPLQIADMTRIGDDWRVLARVVRDG